MFQQMERNTFWIEDVPIMKGWMEGPIIERKNIILCA